MEQSFWDKVNGFWQRLGVKPAVGNSLITGIVATLAYWLLDGGSFNADELRLLVGTFLLSLIGAASPPSLGTIMTKEGVQRKDPEQPGTRYKV